MPNVLLFRDPVPGPSTDPYEDLFQQQNLGYTTKCVPVLETTHANIDELASRLVKGYEKYSGMVITSKRSCEAVHEALSNLSSDDNHIINNNRESLSKALAHWSSVPFYVVGEGTSTAIHTVQRAFHHLGFTKIQTKGEASGTGEQLGHFIVKEHDQDTKAPLLYLTGDKNRDTVPTLLTKGNIKFESLRVYETTGRKDFERLLEDAVASFQDANQPWWITYFAPSSASFVFPLVQTHPALRNARIAAIGPVTSTHLEKEMGVSPQVVATNPKPEDLVSAIVEYDGAHPYTDE
ncbi:hypothetical protein CC2G_002159 [Coprinopsis cinerea AmutBmut pab1-1]|nr:hypothetical protein CC2G_002159 [Coprinopsis cinerea AmutBmut pab1-1]